MEEGRRRRGGGGVEEGRRRSGGGEEEGWRRGGGGEEEEDIEKGEVEGNVRREHDKNRMYAIISFLYLPPFPPHILPFPSSHPPLPPLTSSPSPPHIPHLLSLSISCCRR